MIQESIKQLADKIRIHAAEKIDDNWQDFRRDFKRIQ
jgi:hypothetical protein